jgi:hypothetical protein
MLARNVEFLAQPATCWPICHLRIWDALCPSYQDGQCKEVGK